ncbi:UDP-glucose 6-dehydrogenase [Penicillium macrosclerotiorum]|uniref:UDP-glucose 6-dehydrogenase n=1 Tax=Penicillium macrosclerotiorum TaxID=303699 RepID=UPI0025483EF4|nr:UDP-glucose 6-dehydrogenase [Penicillium macrosclerotiorum]KAJ5693456.1 UDP-glucose 6-dehydrogenase [Penicillium macrosclerotiorum]
MLSPASVADSETYASVDASTVPTTPDRSASCSPVLNGSMEARMDDPKNLRTTLATPPQKPIKSPLENDHRTKTIRSICCVGAGYVGGPTAAVIALKNPSIKVTVVDRDDRRIRRWNSRHLPIYEPGLAEIVRIARDGLRMPEEKIGGGNEAPADSTSSSRAPNLFFSTDVTGCIRSSDAVFIAVNTPTKLRGTGKGSATDMTSFEAVAAEVVRHARDGTIIVEKSTVPCKTAQMIQEMIRIQRPEAHFEILSNPEFLAAGTAVEDLLRPDRIIIGSSPNPSGVAAAEALARVYASWIDRSHIITTNVWSSELAKLVANSMLAQRLSSINSISAICEATGAEINEVSAAIGADTRLGSRFLRAGIGFGGSCFKKDVLSLVYLAESLGLSEVGEYWRRVVEMNEYQRNRFSARVIRRLNSTLVTKKICVLGYAFKKNTSDTREAPALEIIKTLLDENPREIAVFDPCCNPAVIENEIRSLQKYGPPVLRDDGGCVKVYPDAYTACAGSNAILLVTEFDEFLNIPPPTSDPSSRKSDQGGLSCSIVSRESIDFPRLSLNAEPECAADCPDCQTGTSYGEPSDGISNHPPKQRLDWARISTEMQSPQVAF